MVAQLKANYLDIYIYTRYSIYRIAGRSSNFRGLNLEVLKASGTTIWACLPCFCQGPEPVLFLTARSTILANKQDETKADWKVWHLCLKVHRAGVATRIIGEWRTFTRLARHVHEGKISWSLFHWNHISKMLLKFSPDMDFSLSPARRTITEQMGFESHPPLDPTPTGRADIVGVPWMVWTHPMRKAFRRSIRKVWFAVSHSLGDGM